MRCKHRLLKAIPELALAALLAVPGIGAATAGVLQRQTEALPDIQPPSGGSAFWIARAMRLNGVPMTIKSFASPTNADDVLHQYEHKLRTSSDMKTRRTHEQDWRVLALMSNDSYVTIRARNTVRGSEGTIAVTPPLAKLKPSKRTRFPCPESLHIVSLQEYEDQGIEAEHISLVSKRSVGIEAQAFASMLSQRGWQLLRSEATANNSTNNSGRRNGLHKREHGHGHVIEAQKAAELALVNFWRGTGGVATTVMVVWRKG
jgi:hypothetical protein